MQTSQMLRLSSSCLRTLTAGSRLTGCTKHVVTRGNIGNSIKPFSVSATCLVRRPAQRQAAVEIEDHNSFDQEMVQKILREQSKDTPASDLKNPYEKPDRKCILCQYDVELDFKNTRLLSQFISPYTGRIYGKHITGLCAYMQVRVSNLIRTARYFGYMAHLNKNPQYLRDPKLFDPFRRR